MRLIQKLLFALAACGFTAIVASAAPATSAPALKSTDYLTLPEAQATDAASKVEVIEFFSYSCPHCNHFDPALAAWVKKNADKVAFKRVHLAQHATEAPLQRLYLSMEIMGITEQHHAKVFNAIHEQRAHLASQEEILDWAAKNGIDRAKLAAVYNSFGMQAKVNRANATVKAYNVNFWPVLAIDGRYMTSPSQVGATLPPATSEPDQQLAALAVMDQLVAKAKAEKK